MMIYRRHLVPARLTLVDTAPIPADPEPEVAAVKVRFEPIVEILDGICPHDKQSSGMNRARSH